MHLPAEYDFGHSYDSTHNMQPANLYSIARFCLTCEGSGCYERVEENYSGLDGVPRNAYLTVCVLHPSRASFIFLRIDNSEQCRSDSTLQLETSGRRHQKLDSPITPHILRLLEH